jgi:hypothetical protein
VIAAHDANDAEDKRTPSESLPKQRQQAHQLIVDLGNVKFQPATFAEVLPPSRTPVKRHKEVAVNLFDKGIPPFTQEACVLKRRVGIKP